MAQLKLAEAAAQCLMEKHFSLGTFGLLARAWLFHHLCPLFGGARVRVCASLHFIRLLCLLPHLTHSYGFMAAHNRNDSLIVPWYGPSLPWLKIPRKKIFFPPIRPLFILVQLTFAWIICHFSWVRLGEIIIITNMCSAFIYTPHFWEEAEEWKTTITKTHSFNYGENCERWITTKRNVYSLLLILPAHTNTHTRKEGAGGLVEPWVRDIIHNHFRVSGTAYMCARTRAHPLNVFALTLSLSLPSNASHMRMRLRLIKFTAKYVCGFFRSNNERNGKTTMKNFHRCAKRTLEGCECGWTSADFSTRAISDEQIFEVGRFSSW